MSREGTVSGWMAADPERAAWVLARVAEAPPMSAEDILFAQRILFPPEAAPIPARLPRSRQPARMNPEGAAAIKPAGGPSMYYKVGDTVTFTDSGTGKTITGARIVAKVDHLLDGAPGFIAVIQKRRTWGLASEISDVAPRSARA